VDKITADRISGRIVEVLNSELALMKQASTIDGLSLLAGHLLAFKALRMTMPAHLLPAAILKLDEAVNEVLAVMLK